MTSVFQLPKAAGYWRISNSFMVQAHKRPRLLHRWFSLMLLGWQWVDA